MGKKKLEADVLTSTPVWSTLMLPTLRASVRSR